MESKEAVIRSKITKPALPRNFLERRRLLETLASIEEPLVLVSASMGAGKTVLLTHFAKENECAWYHLDETDNDLMAFVRYFVRAIQGLAPTFSVQFEPYTIGSICESSAHNLALDCVEALYDIGAHGLRLVLDDFHVMENELVLLFLTTLVERLDGELQLIVCSKSAMPPCFARLVVSQLAVHLSANELAFTELEIAQLSRTVAPTQAPDTIAQMLYDGLEGWPAGVMTALLHFRAGGEVLDFDEEVMADVPHLRDYFMHELFRKLPFDLQAFLTNTAILEYLQPDLCNLLTGRQDAAAQLAYLEQENLFVIRTSGSRRFYRYHSLFRQFLLTLSTQETQQALAEQVVERCLSVGNRRWAVEYAIDSRNHNLMTKTVELVGIELLENGEMDSLRRCLDVLEKAGSLSPRLRLFDAWYHQRFAHWQQAFDIALQVREMEEQMSPLWIEATNLLVLAARWQGQIAESERFLADILPMLRQRSQVFHRMYRLMMYFHANNLLDLQKGKEAEKLVEETLHASLPAQRLSWTLAEITQYLPGLDAQRVAALAAPKEEMAVESPEDDWLQVTCFGKLRVTTKDGTEITWRTRKTKELFAYLYHRMGQSVTKEQLMELLWPQSSASNATSLFHTSLYNIRKALSPYPSFASLICHGKLGYTMEPSLVRSNRAVVDGFTKGDAPFPDYLEPEVLYAGAYLEDVEGAWCADARAYYSGLLLKVYRRFGVSALDGGDAGRAAQFFRAAVAQEPYDEELAGLLIRAYTASGEMKNAMAIYGQLKAVLKADLDVEPGEEVTGVYRQCLLKRLESRRDGR